MRRTVFLIALAVSLAFGQSTRISPPKIGDHAVGDDYILANYTQLREGIRPHPSARDRQDGGGRALVWTDAGIHANEMLQPLFWPTR